MGFEEEIERARTVRAFRDLARKIHERVESIEVSGGGTGTGTGPPGPQGPPGKGFHSGIGPPPAIFGQVGDTYFDVSTGDVYLQE